MASKQVNNRNRLARQYLTAELRLSRQYAQEQDTDEYKRRVVFAADKVQHYAKNCSDGHAQFLRLFIDGYDQVAICNAIPIQPSTYYAWRRSIIQVFGRYMGIFI
jgi:hypothetical protein